MLVKLDNWPNLATKTIGAIVVIDISFILYVSKSLGLCIELINQYEQNSPLTKLKHSADYLTREFSLFDKKYEKLWKQNRQFLL